MHFLLDFTKNLIPTNWKTSSSGWTSGNCPMCTHHGQTRPDTKGRGGFLFESDKFRYHCFNCGYTTGWSPGHQLSNNLKKLYSVFGVDSADIQRLQIELMRERDTAELLMSAKQAEAPLVIDWPLMELPPKSHSIFGYPVSEIADPERFVAACEYIADRGLLDYPDWYYSSFSHFKNRIILPFRYKNQIVGYTARWVGQPGENESKYFTHQPKNFVFNLDMQLKRHRYVIVTEGQLDALSVDGVGIGSNNLSHDQCRIIENLKKEVILLPDADASSYQLVEQAVKRGWSVSFPPWDLDVKDANDAVTRYGKLFTLKTIIDSAVNNGTKALVMARKYCKINEKKKRNSIKS